MTVHFKGTSRHLGKHKARRAMRLAGLRSDQLGICREPQFQSKKRAPLEAPQVATSLQWGDPGVSSRGKIRTRPAAPPAVVSVAQTGDVENVETPLAPRPSEPRGTSKMNLIQEECSSGHISRAAGDEQTQKQPADGINHVLRKKAGLKSDRQRDVRRSSEYQRQFQWKTPAAESPLLTAQEILYSSNRSIPPFKSNPIVIESEYKRNFKGSPPPRGPRLRRDMELNEIPPLKMEDISPEKAKKKKRRHQRLRRKSSPKEKTPHSEQQHKPETTRPQKAASPKVMRNAKTEYSSNFRSPFKYCYKNGAWIRSRTVGEEVQELREKAESYRKRAWGTHFSRQHLGQILAEQNCLWEVSSGSSPSTLTDEDPHASTSPMIEALDLASIRESCSPSASVSSAASRRSSCKEAALPSSPTLPGPRRMAWDEEVSPCERSVAGIKQQRKEQPEETNVEGDINGHLGDDKEEDPMAESEHLSHAEESESSSDEGRLPTPKLKTMLAAQRTHHDRTTPAAGGAILVSPLKITYSKNSRRSEPPLGKAHSPYRHLSCVSIPDKTDKTGSLSLSRRPVAAGMATVDPLPLREDTRAEDSPDLSPSQKPARKPSRKQPSSDWHIESTPQYTNRIQGTLRNPEFQHNGNLGAHWPERIALPSDDCLSDDDLDDRMSQISFQSAASCSMASQVLDRAQKRKEHFWGKS